MNSAHYIINVLVVRTFWMGEFFSIKVRPSTSKWYFMGLFLLKIKSFNEVDKPPSFKIVS